MKKYTHYHIRRSKNLNFDFHELALKKQVGFDILLYSDKEGTIEICGFSKYKGEYEKRWKKLDYDTLKPIMFAWMHEAFSAVTNEQKK